MTLLAVADARLEPVTPRSAIAKRSLDLCLGTLLLVLAIPIMAMLALAILLADSGPVLYRQTRIGRYGRPFVVRKLRTMRPGADAELEDLRHLNEVPDGPMFKIRDDPRVTSIGHWLRRLSLDELPQLINVVTGSMSLVGPRPALPGEVTTYSESEAHRLLVRPGLTGPWQVGGRSDLSWPEGMAMDLEYVERGSLMGDLTILARTLPAVLGSRGAY